jgi:hypothetical protein
MVVKFKKISKISILEKITESNWRELASQVAQEIFPEGTLVDWNYAGINFGIVTSISKTGKITIQRGQLPLEKVTDNENGGGMYGKFWYRTNLDEFMPYKKEELEFSSKTPKTRFNPRCFRYDWKKTGYEGPIEWYQVIGNRGLILGKPKINKKGLIMEESYSG